MQPSELLRRTVEQLDNSEKYLELYLLSYPVPLWRLAARSQPGVVAGVPVGGRPALPAARAPLKHCWPGGHFARGFSSLGDQGGRKFFLVMLCCVSYTPVCHLFPSRVFSVSQRQWAST